MKNDSHNDTHQDSRKGDERYRRVELITGTTRRLRRSDEERARILAESFEPGANIAAVARRHGVNGGLLHYWRKRAKAEGREAAAVRRPLFGKRWRGNPCSARAFGKLGASREPARHPERGHRGVFPKSYAKPRRETRREDFVAAERFRGRPVARRNRKLSR